jgi:hypothetical protein
VIKENPELGRRAILMRKFGQEIIEATAGKKIHGTGAIPGGINRNLPFATRDALLAQIDEMEDWAMDALALARGYTLDNATVGPSPPSRRTTCRWCVQATARSTSITAICARSMPDGGVIFDGLDYSATTSPGRRRALMVLHEVPLSQGARATMTAGTASAPGAHEHRQLDRHAAGQCPWRPACAVSDGLPNNMRSPITGRG